MDSTKLAKGRFRHFVMWVGEHPLLCALSFFALSVVVRLLCNRLLGPMVLSVFPDEHKYLHIARSIAEGGPLIVRGMPTDYQKILYPLLISPAFLLTKDPITQIKLVGIINILVMSSAVFPAALLVRKLTPRPAVLLITLVFAVALPDFIYSAMLLSEVLYWPLSIWVFYFFHRAMAEREPRKRLLLFTMLGFFAYLAYLTKEIGAAYLIAAAAVLVIEGVRGRRDRYRLKQSALDLGLCAAVFFAVFLILKLTLFSSMGNSYSGSQNGWDQIGLSVFKEYPDAFTYMLYSAVSVFLAAILSFYILPVLLPLFGFSTMDEGKRRIYLFSAVSLGIIAGVMAYTVSIRETPGDEMPRWHMRLLAPLAIPFVILCFDVLLSKGSEKQKQSHSKHKQLTLILTAIFCTLLLALLPTIPTQDNQVLDHASLAITCLEGICLHMGMDLDSINMMWVAYKLFMLALVLAGVLLLLKRKKRAVSVMLLCVISAVSVSENLVNYQAIRLAKQPIDLQTYFAMRMSERGPGNYVSSAMDVFFSPEIVRVADRLTDAAVSVSGYLRQLDDASGGSAILAGMNYRCMNYIETYAPQRFRIIHTQPDLIQEYRAAGIGEISFDEMTDEELRVNYILITEDYNPFANVEVVYEQAPYIVLRNLDPAKVCFIP